MKRVLTLMMVIMLSLGLSSCADKEYGIVDSLVENSPWGYNDGDVHLRVKFKDISGDASNYSWNRELKKLELEVTVRYVNKKEGISFTIVNSVKDKYAGYRTYGVNNQISMEEVTIVKAYKEMDILMKYNNDNDTTFEFKNLMGSSPLPFILPLYHLKPIK